MVVNLIKKLFGQEDQFGSGNGLVRFPMYICEDWQESVDGRFIKTTIYNVINGEDFGVAVDHDFSWRIRFRTTVDIPKIVKELHNDNINIFVQDGVEYFWAKKITSNDIKLIEQGPLKGYYEIRVPLENWWSPNINKDTIRAQIAARQPNKQ